jgi:hypothetical protein
LTIPWERRSTRQRATLVGEEGIRVHERLEGSRLAAVAVLGFLLFNYPLLSLFDTGTRVLALAALSHYVALAVVKLKDAREAARRTHPGARQQLPLHPG